LYITGNVPKSLLIIAIRRSRMLMLGLDGVGKTTMLYKIKSDKLFNDLEPTIGFNLEDISYQAHSVYDISGAAKLRSLWKYVTCYLLVLIGNRYYYQGCSCIIWVLDSGDYERLGEVKRELHNVTFLI
jgi:ADP-ribosylation factor protein 1